MSDLEKFGTRSDPIMGKCAKCGDATPLVELDSNADSWCNLCMSLDRLQATLEKQGKYHRNLFDRTNQLPPSDR